MRDKRAKTLLEIAVFELACLLAFFEKGQFLIIASTKESG